ncbi:hypothetical protein GCM10023165_19920 [Variovorax defluvii]|uniref:Filamentous haemagglutinin FhaB/tRNA nuclease CdiA-like TPS domain-containing protein n=1 Tax=Variovorax defluvii TaxID=913761 RepID=A0ABP8HJF5_9BURK
MRVVVQETARAAGKATGATAAVLGTALLAAAPAPAQIVGAPGVPPDLRPIVLQAPNGVPLVNIQTPSAAGVSRNLYLQFDVQSRGVILNNSRTDVQTQLGGRVQANPFLANGPARIILNEVVSGNPTQLRGAIEVGGQRAEVIVANPAGIAVDGSTFINASRATLTTGKPLFDASGGLEGYVVRDGTVTLDGAGLDARSTDYAAILARAVQVNAGLWAKELKVASGANQVSADHGQVAAIEGSGAKPVFLLDVAHLGGMYANKIFLVGTEHGVGARNAGTIVAADGSGPLGGVGELVVTAEGRLENIGTLQAGTRADIAAASLANRGRVASGRDLRIATQGTLGNVGTLEAQSLQLASAGDIDNRGGTMRQAGGVGLAVTANGLSNTGGGVIGALPASTAAGGGAADISTTQASPAPGAIAAAGTLLNDGGRIDAGGPITLATRQLDNAGGSLSIASLAVNGPSFGNAGGSVQLVDSFSANVDRFDNAGGVVHGGNLQIASSGDLINSAGAIVSNGHAAVAAANLGNEAGRISAVGDLRIVATALDNTAGLLAAGDSVSILDPRAGTPGAKTLRMTNTDGTVLAAKALVVDAASLGFDGKLLSKGDMRLTLNQDVVVAEGSRTTASRDLSIATGGSITNSGKLAAGHALTLSARNIDNTASGDIQSKTTRLAASETITNRGVIDGVVTRIDAATLSNIGTGRIYGDAVSLGADTLNNLPETVSGVASAATIAARDRLAIGARTVENRDGALIFSDGDLAIGGSLDATGRATGAAASLNNHAATIEATRSVRIRTAALSNTNGGVTWTLQPGAGEHVVEYAIPGSATRHPASQVLFATGGYLLTNSTGWNNWVATDASNPLLPGANADARLLLPSPDYPLERFRAYYLRSPANSADRSYQTCTGGDAGACETTAMPGAWYARDDPIWATFGVAPPPGDLPARHPGRIDPGITVGQQGLSTTVDGPSGPVTVILQRFDHPVTQAEYDQWQAYRAAHQALDVATLDFIHAITGVVRGPEGDKAPRLYSTYDAFDYSVTPSTPVLQSSAPARLLAGGSMDIQVGTGTNDMSQILAGGTLTVSGGVIANVGRMVDAPTVQTGTAIHSDVQNDRRTYQFAPYDLTTNATVALAAARQEGNVAFAGTGQLVPGQIPQGAGVNPIVQVPSAAGSGQVVRTSTPNAAIPTASLFFTHPDPGSRYLVETDPRFANDQQQSSLDNQQTSSVANERRRLSSDALLRSLGIDRDGIQKRLGDGLYEQRLIREQLTHLTGERHLNGFDSDDAQYAALMDAGATFAKEYRLRPGITLTAEQMAQLTSDIVWLVEQEVVLADGSTQKVLVPQVYVRLKEGDIDGSGALLGGRNVNLHLAGDLTTQGGTIAGREAVVISAQNIHNLGGRIAGDDVALAARQDIDVIGGSVDAQNSLTAAAGRDIHVVTTTREAASDTGMLFGSDAASGVRRWAAATASRPSPHRC